MKSKTYIFWIRSNKGTDSQSIVRLDGSLKRKEISKQLEGWCSQFGAMNHSDNIVQYGWTEATKTNLNKLSKYSEMNSVKSQKMELLIRHSITPKMYNEWLKKNKKKIAFPFK